MIVRTTVKLDDRGCPGAPEERQFTAAAALRALVDGELGYGATVTAVSPDRIALRLQLAGVVSTVTFTGAPADLRPLVEAAAA